MSNDDSIIKPLDPATTEFRDRLDPLCRSAQIGACVNGVAHDINNLLGAAMAYAELVSLDKDLGPEPKRMLGEVVNSTRRCSELVSTLTAIARKDVLNPSVTEAPKITAAIESLVGYTIRAAKIRFTTTVEEDMPSMWCDSPKLLHALLALLANAREAVITTEDAWIELGATRADGQIQFSVSDSAPDIEKDVSEKMFTAGFSTKPDGGHVGLGLPRAREIAELHNGTLEYDAEQGFILRIDPAHLAAAREEG